MTDTNQASEVLQAELRQKLVVYLTFYVEARDAKSSTDMAKWIDKIEHLISRHELQSRMNEIFDVLNQRSINVSHIGGGLSEPEADNLAVQRLEQRYKQLKQELEKL